MLAEQSPAMAAPALRAGERRRVIRDDDDDAASRASVAAAANRTNPAVNGQPAGQSNMTPQRLHAARIMEARRRRVYDFSETPDLILAKYANDPPSLELHIHHTHYRFGNQEGILSKNTPSIKTFFEYVARGEIPPAATEVFRDAGIRFYEGCIIMKLIDHRDVRQESTEAPAGETSAASSTPDVNGTSAAGGTPASSSGSEPPKAQPASYRVLLRPTPLSLWHDLLYTADTTQGRFSDMLALNMEQEILSVTIRNVDLRVPERAPPAAQAALESSKSREAQWKKLLQTNKIESDENGKISKKDIRKLHSHRLTHPKKRRGLHEDMSHHGTEFEELMLIMDERNQNAANGGTSGVSGQFMRLSFIEQMRKKRLLEKQQRQNAGQPTVPGVPGHQMPQGQTHLTQMSQQMNALAGNTNAMAAPPARNQFTKEEMAQLAQQRQQQIQMQTAFMNNNANANANANGAMAQAMRTNQTNNAAFAGGLNFDNRQAMAGAAGANARFAAGMPNAAMKKQPVPGMAMPQQMAGAPKGRPKTKK